MWPDGDETISGRDAGIFMECDKKCHTVESAGIPFYNVVRGIEGGSRRGPCRIIPNVEE
jgi:hypothetical protein